MIGADQGERKSLDCKRAGISHMDRDGMRAAITTEGGPKGRCTALMMIARGYAVANWGLTASDGSTVALHPSGETFLWAASGWLGENSWNQLRPIRRVRSDVRWWSFVNDRLAVGHDGISVSFWWYPSLEKLSTHSMENMAAAALDPSGRHLAVTDGESVRIYEIVY